MVGDITQLMIKQHAILNKILADFVKSPSKDFGRITDDFSNFRWGLQKHMFLEENNFFNVIDRNDKEQVNQVNSLFKDHQSIRAVIDNMTEELFDRKKPEVGVLKRMLLGHEGREIQMFYPKLDKYLSKKDKKEIFSRTREIKIGFVNKGD